MKHRVTLLHIQINCFGNQSSNTQNKIPYSAGIRCRYAGWFVHQWFQFYYSFHHCSDRMSL
jgi:hypothetical protein